MRGTAIVAAIASFACAAENDAEQEANIPTTPISEMTYSPAETLFELWSPDAERVEVVLYEGDTLVEEIAMTAGEKGLWHATAKGDRKGMYYAFRVTIGGKSLKESAGIFAKALDVNGNRGAIIDMRDTDPEGWSEDKVLDVELSKSIIYEMHYRDMTAHASAGSKYPGKYIGMAERGTRSFEGLATGIDHLVELGITHVHLLPTADFGSIDESEPTDQYNWGL